jgi:hypothetical protein
MTMTGIDLCRSPMRTLGVTAFVVATALAASAQAETNEELAMQMSNPVAALISVPFQFNYDQNIGSARDGKRWLLNIQPVVPFDLNADWNLISRTILPVVWQDEVFPGAGSQSGIGDIVQSVFFSPKAPTAGGLIWGAGPVLLLPTGSNDLLTTDKWGAGPTGVVIRQQGPWTAGALANHIWSFAGNSSRADVNATFLQPFLTYTTPTATTFSLNTESTYDWNSRQWSVPINTGVSQILRLGDQLVQVGAVARYWAATPESGPQGWGLRLNFTFLFPR